jgi:hypothetical protein
MDVNRVAHSLIGCGRSRPFAASAALHHWRPFLVHVPLHVIDGDLPAERALDYSSRFSPWTFRSTLPPNPAGAECGRLVRGLRQAPSHLTMAPGSPPPILGRNVADAVRERSLGPGLAQG